MTDSHDTNKSVTLPSVKWKNASENQSDRHCDKSKGQTSRNQQITIIATFIVITGTFSFTLFFFPSKSMSCFFFSPFMFYIHLHVQSAFMYVNGGGASK